jgi:hypothetical protein
MLACLDPISRKAINFPEWGLLANLTFAVHRAGLSWPARWRCYREGYRWVKSRRGRLLRDLVLAARHFPGLDTRSATIWNRSGGSGFARPRERPR